MFLATQKRRFEKYRASLILGNEKFQILKNYSVFVREKAWVLKVSSVAYFWKGKIGNYKKSYSFEDFKISYLDFKFSFVVQKLPQTELSKNVKTAQKSSFE